MTKEVSVIIEGYQAESNEEPVITRAPGTYHLHKDRHYISYEEPLGEGEGVIRSRIRLDTARVEMTRSGAACARMSFEESRNTEAVYQTPYGELRFEIRTSRITIGEVRDRLEAGLEYSLFSNGTCVSRHRTVIKVVPQ